MALLRAAVACVLTGASETVLVVAADRTSNGPLLVYPQAVGDSWRPATEHWVLKSFARDPQAGQSMLATAQAVAAEEAVSRSELGDVAAQRALKAAGLTIDDVDLGTAYNRFAVQRRVLRPGDRLRPRPHEHPRLQPVLRAPAGPDGLRSIAELVTSLRERGGGTGLFPGCAGGDTGAAVVLRVSD